MEILFYESSKCYLYSIVNTIKKNLACCFLLTLAGNYGQFFILVLKVFFNTDST